MTQDYYEKCKREGRCYNCGSKLDRKGVVCIRCYEKRKAYKKKRVVLGFCYNCNQPRGDSKSVVYCARCLEHVEARGRQNQQKLRSKLKTSAFEKLGGSKCARCGQTDMRILEINHKNGGGSRERKESGVTGRDRLYRNIVKNRRATDDLEVLCKVCNAAHFVELKFGLSYIIQRRGSKL